MAHNLPHMPRLKDFEGQVVTLVFIRPNAGGLLRERVTLVNVEDAGIWIENQSLTNEVLEKLELPNVNQRALFFYPFSAFHAIFVTVPGTSLSEKAFGV
jgi:hypothetical protein